MRLRLLGCVVLAALSAFAQSDRGTLTGTVADLAGAVVAGARMEIRNVETGATSQAASTDTGNYTLPQLPVGSYELTVTVPGFKKYVRQRIVIQVAQTLRLDVTLEVGAVSDSVTVTSETTMLKTESGELSHVVSVERLQNLPILAIGGAASSSQGLRFYLAQTQLIPGTSYSNGVNSVRVNGAPNGTFRTQIEGMDATNALIPFSAASLQPSIDAVEETN
ncbi:MAG: carboxypeptidase-like regulatory domain-containing protein, partial [Acidobacteriota bacterium]